MRAMKAAEGKTAADVQKFVDLDLPPEQRWAKIGAVYADRSWQLVKYLKDNLQMVGEPLTSCCRSDAIFSDYGDEMKGYSKALGITEGDIVMINLVYQLEHLGILWDCKCHGSQPRYMS